MLDNITPIRRWSADDGLNGGAELVSVDLSKAPGGLTAGEKAAIAYVFAQKHDVQGLTNFFAWAPKCAGGNPTGSWIL